MYNNKNQACTTNIKYDSFEARYLTKWFNNLFMEIHCTTLYRVSISIYEYGNKCHLEGSYFQQHTQRVVTNSYQTSTQKVNDVIPLHETPFCVH